MTLIKSLKLKHDGEVLEEEIGYPIRIEVGYHHRVHRSKKNRKFIWLRDRKNKKPYKRRKIKKVIYL